MQLDKISCLIIDDDPFIVELLQDKLHQYFPEVMVLDTASSGKQGFEKIKEHAPELVFLDVEMADMTGFEMLGLLPEINFKTIFITSYSHYAIKAIRFNALDYLLKPIDLGELKSAVKRYKSKAKAMPQNNMMGMALKNIANTKVAHQQLVLKTQDGDLRLTLKDIIRIEGERNYSYIYLVDDRKKLVTKTLIELEDLLDDKGFYRVHRSHIVNVAHIAESSRGFTLSLTGSIKVPISRRKKKQFLDWFEAYKNNAI